MRKEEQSLSYIVCIQQGFIFCPLSLIIIGKIGVNIWNDE